MARARGTSILAITRARRAGCLRSSRGRTRRRGRAAAGQFTAVAFEVAGGSLSDWRRRLASAGVESSDVVPRFGAECISFRDPDGLTIELIGSGGGPSDAIGRLHSATLATARPAESAATLTGLLGFDHVAEETDRVRYRAGDGFLDVIATDQAGRGKT